jgi:hypothetical protein
MPPSLIKIIGPQFTVGFIAGEHIKDTDHDGVRNGEDRPAFPSTCRQAPIQNGQTVSSLTLLVNSKTPWMATLHPTVESQRDRGYYVKQYSSMLLEIQWPRLNQQSRSWHGL